jgi:hypothetical protein
MAILESERNARFHHAHRTGQREASLLFLLAYPFCLAAAIGHRMGTREAAGQGSRRSVFGEARSSARSIIPFAFR